MYKKESLLLLLFTLIIVFSQFLILNPQLEFGFSPDDVRAISNYKDLGDYPFAKFVEVWSIAGPHYANQVFYNGLLYNFFGFNYQAYYLTGLIFKIFSIISFYLLIQFVFKKPLLAFVSALIFALHFGTVDSMEMVLKTPDYLVITGINIFLIFFYYYYSKNIKSRLKLFLLGILLFFSFFLQPIRAFPILPFIVFIAACTFFNNRSSANFFKIVKDLLVLFSPFLILLIFGSGSAEGLNNGNLRAIIQKVTMGNLQFLLTPITTLGSLFLYGSDLKSLSFSRWDTFGTYLSFILWKPLFIFGFVTLILSFIISKKPFSFFASVLTGNLVLEILLFFMVNKALNLPTEIKMHYDPFIFLPPTILGIYMIVLTLFAFMEWKHSTHKNIYLTFFLLGMLYAGTFILFHWFFQHYVFIPYGIKSYGTLPTMGVCAGIGGLFLLGYSKLKNRFKSLASTVFLLIIPFAILSNNHIQDFNQGLLNNGLKAKDQIDMKNQFWQQITNLQRPCNKLFYFSAYDYPNGTFYSFILLDEFYMWYKLYNPVRYNSVCPIGLIVNDEEKLLSSYFSVNKEKGFLQKRKDEAFIGNDLTIYKYKLEDFYALKLQDRKIINIRPEIMSKIK